MKAVKLPKWPKGDQHPHVPRTWWDFEVASISISFLTFVALVIVLQQYDGQPQIAWPYNQLTLNGLVALLSTITRATLMIPIASAISQSKWTWFTPKKSGIGRPLDDLELIDSASRGAMGSLQLLWRMKGRHLVTVGALLTILILAFDTFSSTSTGSTIRHRYRP